MSSALDQILLIPAIGRRGVPVDVPTGFDFTPPFDITKFGKTKFTTNVDIDFYQVESEVTYYLSPDGDDSNDGLTIGEPKKSISTLISALNADPPTGATLILAPGTYAGTDAIYASNFTFPCNVICPSGRALLSYFLTPTWTKTAGRDNVYQFSSGAAIPAMIDHTNVDEFGFPKRLRIIGGGDIAAVDATPGSCAIITSTTFIHLHDSREPDGDVTVFGTGINGVTQTSDVDLFFRNIDLWGWNQNFRRVTTGSGQTVFDNSTFLYGRNGDNSYFQPTGASLVLLNNCTAAYAWSDGFNHRNDARVVEIGCRGVYNGLTASPGSENGSTTHNNVRSIRINGIYTHNMDRNIHDITETRNWLMGCQSGFAQNGSTNKYANANFVFGREGQTDATLAWLDGCTSLGGSASDLGAYGDSVVKTRDVFGMNITDGDGTIESY